MKRAKVALGNDAIEFFDPAVYTEKFNLCTTQRNLDDPALRRRIVAFVRALIAATQQLKDDPQSARQLVAHAAALDMATVSGAWQRFNYPGTLVTGLLDVFARQDLWIAKVQGRVPRSRDALSKLIDDSVLREALAG